MTAPESDAPRPAVGTGGAFVTTHWSVVMRAGGHDGGARQALSELCSAYWFPLYAFARRQGHSPSDAEDLTQGFFAQLIQKDYVGDAQPAKGRFRTFLLTAFQRFRANAWDRQHAAKRGAFTTAVSIDPEDAEARLGPALAHHESPDRLFDRQWAVTLLERVMRVLQSEYAQSGRGELFALLQPALTRDGAAPGYRAIAGQLGLTEAAVKMAAQRLRRRYRELLRDAIASTVSSPAEIDDEIRHLFASFEA